MVRDRLRGSLIEVPQGGLREGVAEPFLKPGEAGAVTDVVAELFLKPSEAGDVADVSAGGTAGRLIEESGG